MSDARTAALEETLARAVAENRDLRQLITALRRENQKLRRRIREHRDPTTTAA